MSSSIFRREGVAREVGLRFRGGLVRFGGRRIFRLGGSRGLSTLRDRHRVFELFESRPCAWPQQPAHSRNYLSIGNRSLTRHRRVDELVSFGGSRGGRAESLRVFLARFPGL